MKEGLIKIPATHLLGMLRYDHLKLEDMTVDLFSNQIIIKVSGPCELYPESVKPIPKRKAVTGI